MTPHFYLRKGVLEVVSLKSIHPPTRQLNFITRSSKEFVDVFFGELTLEKRLSKHPFDVNSGELDFLSSSVLLSSLELSDTKVYDP